MRRRGGPRQGGAAPPDLILLDLMLPRMDGWELCERLRRLTTAPLIMLTARTSVSDKVRGLNVGADDYLEKPYDPRELLARVRAHLRRARDWNRPASPPRGPIVVGALRIDPRGIDVHIRHPRAKIEADPADPRRIWTVHGVGYKLVATDPP